MVDAGSECFYGTFSGAVGQQRHPSRKPLLRVAVRSVSKRREIQIGESIPILGGGKDRTCFRCRRDSGCVRGIDRSPRRDVWTATGNNAVIVATEVYYVLRLSS